MAIDGVPKDLALKFKELVNCETFIETGTYKAFTVFWAKEHFERVITTELDHGRFERNRPHFATNPKIEFLEGNSGDLLPEILKQIDSPVIFWLDAHGLNNPAEETFENTECPLMVELEAIRDWHKVCNQHHLILIDDARLFVKPPPPPWTPSRWPSIVEIENYLADYSVYINDDVIIAIPSNLEKVINEWVESKLA